MVKKHNFKGLSG